MKIAKLLIIAAGLLTLIAIISRLTCAPVAHVASRPMAAFAGLLLLFAIALEGLK